MEAVAKLGINPIYLLSQLIVFSVLAFLLARFLYNPILNMLEKRKEQIAKGLEDARAAEEARARADEEAAQIVEAARKQAQGIVAEANASAEQVRTNIKLQAEEEARKIQAQAEEDAELKRDQALDEMRSQISALAIAAAQKILGESLDKARQTTLVKSFFSGIESGKIAVLESAKLVGNAAVVTSALPLDEAEQQSYQSALAQRLGDDVSVTFRTDPSIMGGVIVRVGDQVVDDSVAGKLDSLRTQLTAG